MVRRRKMSQEAASTLKRRRVYTGINTIRACIFPQKNFIQHYGHLLYIESIHYEEAGYFYHVVPIKKLVFISSTSEG